MENELEKRQEKFSSILKNKKVYFYLFLAIMILALIIRLYYFWHYKAQPLWWDEAQYLWRARVMARGNWFVSGWNWDSLLFEGVVSPHKPFLIIFVGAFFYLFGLNGEIATKFFMVLISLAGIAFTYLVGKEMYNKKVGLIAFALMSTFYLYNFYSYRIETNVLGAALWTITVFLFWKGYIKKPDRKYMLLAGVFMMLSVMGRTPMAMMIIPILLTLLLKERLMFLKNKNFWFFALGNMIVLVPYMIWSQLTYGLPLALATEWGFASGLGNVGANVNIFYTYIQFFFTTYLNSPLKILLILLIAGLIIYIFNIAIGFDIMIKKRDKKLIKTLFMLTWFIFPIIAFGFWLDQFEPRLIMVVFPAAFIIIGNTLMKGYNYFKKYSKAISITILLIIVISSMGVQLKQGDELIKSKGNSYLEVKEAGLWINQNSNPDDVVFSNSRPQTMFYADRENIGFHKKAVRYNSSLEGDDRYLSEKEFEEMAIEKKAKYLVISVFEPYPTWAYNYAKENPTKVTPVMGYFTDEAKTQPTLVIYGLTFT